MIDYVLLVCLVAVLPAWALYKSVRGTDAVTSRPWRYLTSGAIIVGLLVLLAIDWSLGVRTAAALGLDIPLSEGGMIGLAVVGLLLAVMVIVEVVAKRTKRGADDHPAKARALENGLLPRTRTELVMFLGLAVLVGCGWELLYRGFLLWSLLPHVGTVAAVCIAAIAYGAAHGLKSKAQFFGSIGSAFAFTIAFVLTGSLWWLMLIHTAMAVVGGIASYNAAARANTTQSQCNANAVQT